jgi:hypothetical protein
MKKGNSVDSNPQKPTTEQQPLVINSADEEWYNIQDMMVHFKMSRRSINRLVQQNKIPSIKLGGTLMFPKNLINNIMLQKALKQMDDKYEGSINPEA